MPIISSIICPQRRFRLAWFDDAFRVPGALSAASQFSTLGDGNTAHTPNTPIATYPLLFDLLRSCRSALPQAIASWNHDLMSGITQAFSFRPAIAPSEAMKACAYAIKGTPSFLFHKKTVTGKRFGNRRDAEPNPTLPEDATPSVKSRYRANLIAGPYPNLLAMLMAADLADEGQTPYALIAISEQTGIPLSIEDGLRALVYEIRVLWRILDSYASLARFVPSPLAEDRLAS